MDSEQRRYDLEERTRTFAQDVRRFVKQLRMHAANAEDTKQLIRSSGSVGANYVESNESLGKRDFLLRIKICRKEAKESMYWLSLVDPGLSEENKKSQLRLLGEANELMKIFGAILRKCQ